MKKILITGTNSYIGSNFQKWLNNYSESYSTESISLRNDSWKELDFSNYDIVFHVAGIAHIKETKDKADLYYRVNRDLSYEVAIKSKNDGVKQFVFLSSMSVYGIDNGVISRKTSLNPRNNYGKSKLQAEEMISSLVTDHFKVAIVRPPMVYGKGCKGNYKRLANIAIKTPVFPNIKNKRSMIYIDNLCELIRLLIDNKSNGVFCPQNEEYVCTSEMVRLINEFHGRKIWMTKLFNPLFKLLTFNTVNKVFGDLRYERDLSKYHEQYNICPFEDSVKNTEVK